MDYTPHSCATKCVISKRESSTSQSVMPTNCQHGTICQNKYLLEVTKNDIGHNTLGYLRWLFVRQYSGKHYDREYSDRIFGSIGKAFDHKWKGIGYSHPNNATNLQHAIHWARLAAKIDPNTITIIISPDTNWYQNSNPHSGPYPDTHIIAHFAADTITYAEPTITPKT